MEFTELVEQITGQAAALRAAAVAAGPDADVPSCPKWTVQRLVGHLAAVHDWAITALGTGPGGEPPGRQPRPSAEGFDEVLGWWDSSRDRMVAMLRELGPGAPVWTMNDDGTTGFWARRQAHELAIHRVDAELAAGTAAPLVFAPAFAADGIDEFLTTMLLGARKPHGGEQSGTILVHAADAQRAWLVAIAPGVPFTVVEQPVVTADASIAGTADAVYRTLWGRPSGAAIGGDTDLVGLLTGP